MAEIKSTAVVAYSNSSRTPLQALELATNTNINVPPPSAWLRGSFSPRMTFSKRSKTDPFDSIVTSNKYVDCVGAVDVITEAESVKELLKLPYNNDQPLSMMVHRVGRTLLLDKFDMYRNLSKSNMKCWDWIKEFMADAEQHGDNYEVTTSKNSPAILYREMVEEHMLSNFLIHSTEGLDDVDDDSLPEILDNDGGQLVPINGEVCVPDPLDGDIESSVSSSPSKGYANLWTFEDIQMLIGVDMPIFGCGKHPCVSLKLHDMKRPISVLTGLDYWLDQLMCNVPEVLMCYHINGIVQKYEIIKTEDLPNIPENLFSPDLVKDVAQNILSFLKGRATKEGHTYWLFREEGSDVVKLYDLTSLCAEYMNDKDANPFTLPVAILMYRVARNLMRRTSQKRTKRVANTVYRLLNNCLELLNRDKYPQVVGSVHYLLANLYLSYGSEGNPGVPKDDLSEDGTDEWACDESWQKATGGEASATVAMDLLMRTPPPHEPGETEKTLRRLPLPNCTNMDDCCKEALEHVYQGLECAEVWLKPTDDETEEEGDARVADPDTPIPLKYESLTKLGEAPQVLLPLAVRRPLGSGWQTDLTSLLLIRAATAYRLLADCSSSLGHLGRAVRQARNGLACVAAVLTIGDESAASKRNSAVVRALVPGLLANSGDALLQMAQLPISEHPRFQADMGSDAKVSFRDRVIIAKVERLLENSAASPSVVDGKDCAWAFPTALPERPYSILRLVERCYETALALTKRSSGRQVTQFQPTQSVVLDELTITRRLGNVKNMLGCAHIDIMKECVLRGELPDYALKMLEISEEDQKSPADAINAIVRRGVELLTGGLKLFRQAGDTSNEALLHSNCGQICRLHSHTVAQENAETQFSARERQLMLEAIDHYQRGLDCVDAKTVGKTWEVVASELASTFYTFAIQLQERPPLSSHSTEDVEKDIVEYMQRALRAYEMLESRFPDAKLAALALGRSFDIHYRLASLYHRSLRSKPDMAHRRAKQLRPLADFHYDKSVAAYEQMVRRWKDCRSVNQSLHFLRVQLERVAFSEMIMTAGSSSAQSPTVRCKPLRRSMRMLAKDCRTDLAFLSESLPSSAVIDSTGLDGEEDDSRQDSFQEVGRLCRMLLDRLQQTSKAIVQVYLQSSKNAKDNMELSQWKRMYSATLVQLSDTDSARKLVDTVAAVCDRVVATAGTLLDS
uniref:Erythroid differentiation-related factor 1 n=1 Tax=Plectus sambesii TaxID=2011161 RepID=A0A914WIX2_9BILA